MESDEVKTVFKEKYSKAGLEIVDENPDQLVFKYGQMKYCVTEEDLKEYAASEHFKLILEIKPAKCSICSLNYREHIIDLLRPRGPFIPGKTEFTFGSPSGDNTYAKISTATMQFINCFRFEEYYLQLALPRLRFFHSRLKSGSQLPDIREALYKPYTIQVYNVNEKTIEGAIGRSSAVIDTCLFELSYLKHVTFGLANGWPVRGYSRVRQFNFGELITGRQLPLPAASFNSDIVRFYQLGMSSDIPVLQFLAFYQVLEYFFVTVSDENLYNKLSRRLNDPMFKTTPNYLDRLIQDVSDHKHVTDEKEMLKNVLTKFVDEGELMEFIRNYEKYLGEKLYTKQRDVFGEKVEIKLEKGHVIGNIAKTIRAVRNALVHSSDRYERSARHVPFSKSTDIVKSEIPLMRFLAERVIIASATQALIP